MALPEPGGGDDELPREFQRVWGLPLTRVGRLTPEAEVRFVHQGRAVSLAGYDHFG